jgi:hypothetical protein
MNPYYSGPLSDHFDGLRFFNPDQVDTDRSFRELLRWKLKEKLRPGRHPSRGIRLFRMPVSLGCE